MVPEQSITLTPVNAARAVLGSPGPAAALERDFGEASTLVKTTNAVPLDPSHVSMVMFLQGEYDLVPDDVPALSFYGSRARGSRKVERPPLQSLENSW